MKRKPKWNKFVVGVVVIGLVIGVIWYYQYGVHKSAPVVSVLAQIEKYNYQLDSNEGKVYERYFKELQEVLAKELVDEERYVQLISKLFLLDFFTLNNKTTNKDIGGVQFVFEGAQENFQLKAADTVYKYIKSNLYGNRKQKLPEVKEVEIISLKSQEVTYKNISDNHGYRVQAKIEYTKDLGYPTTVDLTFLHDGSKISLAEIK